MTRAVANGLCRPHLHQSRRSESFTAGLKASTGRRGPKPRKAYDLGNGMAMLPLFGNEYPNYTFIDAADLDAVAHRRWKGERREQTFYVRCVSKCGREGEYLHRVLMGKAPKGGLTVDHLNCDGLDSQRANLHWATAAEQAETRSKCGRARARMTMRNLATRS